MIFPSSTTIIHTIKKYFPSAKDACFILGFGLIFYGTFMIHRPLAFIVSGTILLSLVVIPYLFRQKPPD